MTMYAIIEGSKIVGYSQDGREREGFKVVAIPEGHSLASVMVVKGELVVNETKVQSMLLTRELQELMMYLTETDYYVIRQVDTGVGYSMEIRNKRQKARERISEIRTLLG